MTAMGFEHPISNTALAALSSFGQESDSCEFLEFTREQNPENGGAEES
jgi:hypothetical protein